MPVSYKWGLWAISLGFVIYLVLTVILIFAQVRTPRRILLGIAILALAAVIFWPVIEAQWKAEKANAMEGDIKSVNPGVARTRLFEIGASGSKFDFSPNGKNLSESLQAIQMLYNAGLQVAMENGEIKVTTPIRDRQGRLVAKIEKNHWITTTVCLDKNYSRDSFEVLDERGLVVFQMRLLPDRVQIQGEWRDEFGNGVRLREVGKNEGGTFSFWHNPEKEQEVMALIEPMFEYPSVYHWGKILKK